MNSVFRLSRRDRLAYWWRWNYSWVTALACALVALVALIALSQIGWAS